MLQINVLIYLDTSCIYLCAALFVIYMDGIRFDFEFILFMTRVHSLPITTFGTYKLGWDFMLLKILMYKCIYLPTCTAFVKSTTFLTVLGKFSGKKCVQ